MPRIANEMTMTPLIENPKVDPIKILEVTITTAVMSRVAGKLSPHVQPEYIVIVAKHRMSMYEAIREYPFFDAMNRMIHSVISDPNGIGVNPSYA